MFVHKECACVVAGQWTVYTDYITHGLHSAIRFFIPAATALHAVTSFFTAAPASVVLIAAVILSPQSTSLLFHLTLARSEGPLTNYGYTSTVGLINDLSVDMLATPDHTGEYRTNDASKISPRYTLHCQGSRSSLNFHITTSRRRQRNPV